MTTAEKTGIHRGSGTARVEDYLHKDEMAGVVTAGRIALEPGASIGEHPHPNNDELYLVLEGRGTGVLNGESFEVETGDMFVLKAGQTHAIINDSDAELVFFMLMTARE